MEIHDYDNFMKFIFNLLFEKMIWRENYLNIKNILMYK